MCGGIDMRTATISKADIIKTAILMIEKGDNITFSTISRKMKMTSQSLYNYFKNQQELEYAIVATVINSAYIIAQRETFGKSGFDGIVSLAIILRKAGIKHIALAQFVVAHPRVHEYHMVNEAFASLKELLDQMLISYFTQDKVLKASRLLRSLLVGDILNVGMGWFKSPDLKAEESFSEMLELSLVNLKKR